MTTIAFRSPVTLPLYRRGTWPYVPPDPRADDAFEVTQQFADIDWYWRDRDIAAGRPPRTHSAVDIGNYSCNSPVLAMAPGVATRLVDPSIMAGATTNALGIRIDHGLGVTTEYWHLNGWTVTDGTRVTAGQQIGVVGSTGLGGACHLHVELKVNGVKQDPEPQIFGAPLTIEEAGLAVTTTALNHIINRRCTLTVASNFRADATRQSAVLLTYAAGTVFVPTVEVTGEAIGTNARWLGGWMYRPDRGYAFGFFHSSVLSALEPIEQADCATQVAEATRTYEVRIDGIKGDAASIVPILERMAKR